MPPSGGKKGRMSVFTITFQAVFALLGIGFLGFLVVGRRRVPSETLAFLSSLAIDIALPCLVLVNLISDFSPQKYPSWWHVPLWWAGFTLLTLILSLCTSYLVKKEVRSEFTISLFYQNGIFFPILIIGGLFGQSNPYLITLFLFTIFHPSMIFSTYTLFFNQTLQKEKLSWQRICNPVLIATGVGIVVGLTAAGDYIPDFLITIITLVGAMATPLFMLILGGNVYNDFIYYDAAENKSCFGDVFKFVLVKNIVFPLFFLALLLWFRPDFHIAFIIILQAAVPPITSIPILAERCQGNRKMASLFIVASFSVSIFSIPAFIYLFNLFFPMPF
ncbi:MAG: AEC family transporter [Deltaproteobacteria bacterium]|nr:AEC family transporter [Deltaproteobacteria bacterium]